MPVLSRSNRAASGIDLHLSIDGRLVVLPDYVGGRAWVSEVEILYQARQGDGYALAIYHTDTGQSRVVLPGGANQFVAGGGVWAAQSSAHGYTDSHGTREPEWYPLAVDDRSGLIALHTRRSDGAGLALWDGHTLRHLSPSSLAPGRVSFREGQFAAPIGAGINRVWDCRHWPDLFSRDTPAKPHVLDAVRSGDYWLGWHESHGLVVYRETQSVGIALSNDHRDHNADLLALDSGLLSVVSSSGAGERPHELRRYRVNPTLGTVNGEAARLVDLTTEEWRDSEGPAHVPAFARAHVPVDVRVFGAPGFNALITNRPDMNDDTAQPFGAFATLGVEDLHERISTARAHGVPLYAYVDDHTYPPHWVPAADVPVIPTVMCYPMRPKGGDMVPVDVAVEDIRSTLSAHIETHGNVCAVVALYRQIDGEGRYNWPLQHVLDQAAAVWQVIVELRIRRVLVFHAQRWQDGDRWRDGVASRVELQEALRRMRAAGDVPEPAPQPEPDPQPEPEPTPEPQPNDPEIPDSSPQPTPAQPGQYTPFQRRDPWLVRLIKAIAGVFR